MIKKKTFLLLTPGFPKDEQDTACLPYLQKFAKAHLQSNPKFELIILSFQYPFINESYYWYGVKVIPFNGANSKNPIKRLLLWKSVWQTLKEINQSNHVIGIFNQWLTECSLIGLKFGRKYNICTKSWLIGQDSDKKNKYIQLIKPRTSEIIAMSEDLSTRLFKNHGIESTQLAYNGIDESDFSSLEKTNRQIDILAVSSLIGLKQVHQWIKIVEELNKTNKNLCCVIIGDGILRNQLENQIQQLQLENVIQLKGYLSHTETLAYMNQSKILLHCSNSEGNCTVFSEALRCGCYVVSYKVGYTYNIPKHLTGSDTHALKNNCMAILNSDQPNFDSQAVHTMTDTYQQILNYFKL
jgi:glycosyltransferase involved in cell wall biosynthesis